MEELKKAIANVIDGIVRLKEASSDLSLPDGIPNQEHRQVEYRHLSPGPLSKDGSIKIFLKDKEGNYVACNEHFARSLNIDPSEIFGKTDLDLFPFEIAEKILFNDRWVLDRKEVSQMEIMGFPTKENRKEKWIEAPLLGPEGEVAGILGVIQDQVEEYWVPGRKEVDELEPPPWRDQSERSQRPRPKEEDFEVDKISPTHDWVGESTSLLNQFRTLIHSMGEIRFL